MSRKAQADAAKAQAAKSTQSAEVNSADLVSNLMDQKILQDLKSNAEEAKDDKIEENNDALETTNANGRMITLEELQQLKQQAHNKAKVEKAKKQRQQLKVTEFTDRHGYLLSDLQLARKRMRQSLEHAAHAQEEEEEEASRTPKTVKQMIRQFENV